MGASAGVLGTGARAVRPAQVLVFLDMPAVNQPEVMISAAADKFDQNGNLTDETPRS